ncbi:MAG TPA: PAS domain-containing sensor histidine kinase, partial [Polyangiaceae bacterium]
NALLANLSEGVVIANPSGRVVMINDAARVILGFEGKDFTVDALNSLETRDLEDGCLDSEQRPLVRALGGESFTDYEVVHVTPTGDRRRVMSTGTNVRDRDGNVALAIVVSRDVTQQRRVEQQRAEYLALVSHDLRNPLNVVVTALSFLKGPMDGSVGPSSGAFRVHAAERAERNARRMTLMLEEITESTNLESQGVALRRVACELRTVVANVLDSMNEGGSGRVTVETDGALPYVVRADAPRLERVVANLVTNALKYSADGAPVTVRLAHEGRDAVLEVTDRGIGIPPESVQRLFERYYRAPGGMAHAGGLGLGLYIAHMIVEAHGGRIDVHSEVGKGSTFRLSLPSYAPDGSPPEAHGPALPIMTE